MRSDYALYVVAIIFFILTGAVAAYQATQSLWIITTAVLGLVFIGVGYTQRPRQTVTTKMAAAPPPPPAPPKVTEVVEEKKPEPQPVVEVKPPSAGLLEVKGIGEKRAAQLKDLSINTVEELAKASAKDLAAKLKISPKITGKWIENAKIIVEKS
jgi:predicted flap endonuclease-1-like 5' DNA nuclease